MKEEKKATVINQDDDANESRQSEIEKEDVVPPGGVSPKEFDYLLTMPLWSLSDEKINELMDQMNKKKSEYETLKGTHIY